MLLPMLITLPLRCATIKMKMKIIKSQVSSIVDGRRSMAFGSHCGTVSVAAGGNRLRILDIKKRSRPAAYIFGSMRIVLTSELKNLYEIAYTQYGQRWWRTKGRGIVIAR